MKGCGVIHQPVDKHGEDVDKQLYVSFCLSEVHLVFRLTFLTLKTQKSI